MKTIVAVSTSFALLLTNSISAAIGSSSLMPRDYIGPPIYPNCTGSGPAVSQVEASRLIEAFCKTYGDINATILPRIAWSPGAQYYQGANMSIYSYILAANRTVRLYLGVYYALENCADSFVFSGAKNGTEHCTDMFGIALNGCDVGTTAFKHGGRLQTGCGIYHLAVTNNWIQEANPITKAY